MNTEISVLSRTNSHHRRSPSIRMLRIGALAMLISAIMVTNVGCSILTEDLGPDVETCDQITGPNVCKDDIIAYCQNGMVLYTACSLNGERCFYVDDQVGFVCTEECFACTETQRCNALGACVAACQVDSCSYHGTCEERLDGIECLCDTGYTGSHCDQCEPGYHDEQGTCALNEYCAAESCSQHGQCTDTTGVIVCTCDAGYAGDRCEQCALFYHWNWDGSNLVCVLDEHCQANSCAGHGTCSDDGGMVVCDCDMEYSGEFCESCAAGYQDNDLNSTCEPDCNTSGLNCGSHGTCDDSSGTTQCNCQTGYAGALCEVCDTGYQDNDINGICQPNCATSGLNCGSHGTCDDSSGTTQCNCQTGYTGALCDVCDTGYQDNDVNGTCQPTCATSGLNCGSHGTCDDSSGTAQCRCQTGYAGAVCDVCDTGYQDNDTNGSCQPTCATSGLNCGSHGTCDDSSGTAQCSCQVGYAGALCDVCDAGYQDNDINGTCQPTCATSGLNCGSHGTCDDSSGTAQCNCQTGYAGALCDVCDTGYQDNDVNGTCEPDCSNFDCSDHGICDDTLGTAFCVCDPGYQDNDGNNTCEPTCITAGNCSGHGTCDDISGTPSCTCDVGYAGQYCDACDVGYQDNDGNGTCLPNCSTSGLDCGLHGTCDDSGGTTVCVCDTGYTGAACDVCDAGYQDNDGDGTCFPDCSTQDCSGHGTCDDISGEAVCTCDDGWGGSYCSIEYYYSVGGVVSGLAPGNSVVLLNNGGDDLSVDTNGTFTFGTALTYGSSYLVSVLTQPTTPNQTCIVSNETGTVAGANVTDVVVTCTTNSYTVGGVVSGLAPGNSVVLLNNGGDDLSVDTNGTFAFGTALTDGSAYLVSLLTQPTTPNQTCIVSNETGTVAGASVTDVVVTCTTNSYTVGGVVSGLAPGNDLVLQNNAGDDQVIISNGSFTFSTAVIDGAAYSVTVSTQPGFPEQHCFVKNGNGTVNGADVTSVRVICNNIRSVSVGASHVCALWPDNSLRCWGYDEDGACRAPAGTNYVSVSAGRWEFGCGIHQSGYISCWGSNVVGESTPPGGSNFEMMSSDDSHSCALSWDGSISCWGWDSNGQATPLPGYDFASVSAGYLYNCTLKQDSSLVCWGDNSAGQASPPSGYDFAAVSAGHNHTCALRFDGSISCWGDNTWGQASPPSGTDFAMVSSGGMFSCALRQDGSLECWGNNSLGRATPPSGNDFAYVSAGIGSACARKQDDTLHCWGYNFVGQSVPPTGSPFINVASGGGQGGKLSCALRENGSVSCWGDNDYGQASAPLSQDFTSIAVGSIHACGMKQDGSITCWGDDTYGQATHPVGVGYLAIAAGWKHSCAIEGDRSLVCWGDDTSGQSSPPSGTDFIFVSAGSVHSCAIRQDYSLVCWGSYDPPPGGVNFFSIDAGKGYTCGVKTNQQLACWGYDTSGNTLPPIGSFLEAAVCRMHSCGLTTSGSLECWGADNVGQSTPPSGSGFVDVSVGDMDSCAVRQTGVVECWGDGPTYHPG